jgi:hypothetical protein
MAPMSCAAGRAIDRLRNARDEIEMALRAPGEMPAVSRQVLESILNDMVETARLIRKMAECHE